MLHARLSFAALLSLGSVAVLGCNEPTPEIEINTYVGDTWARQDDQLQREAMLEVLTKAVPELWGSAQPASSSSPTPTALPDTVHPPRTPEELQDLVVAIRKGPIDELGGPARRIAAASPELWPQIREAMLADRKAPKGDYRSLLAAIGGDVPNRYGHFARAWKKAHGYDVKLSQDWFEDLLALPRSKISPVLLEVYRDCVLQTALLRAAGHIGVRSDRTQAVIEALLDAAYIHQGTFRDEVGRAIQSVGDEAIPHLLVASVLPQKARKDDLDTKRAEYARYNLDRMDRLHPRRAVQAVREDPRLLAAVLQGYGASKMGEAAELLLEYVDDRTPAVRTAARQAFLAYVLGPAPKAKSRQVRLLGGGTGRARAYLTYRQRADQAIRDTLARQAPLLLEPQCELLRENGTTDEDCERAPQRHTESYFDWLDLQRALQQKAKVDAALAAADPVEGTQMLDRLLAEDPHPVEAERIAEFFAAQGERARADGQPGRAGQLLRKASMLLRPIAPERAASLHTAALQAEAEDPAVSAQGRAMLLEAAGAPAPLQAPVQATVPQSIDRLSLLGRVGWIAGGFLFLGFASSLLRRRLIRRAS